MKLKDVLKSPYPYIFLFTFAAVWVVWEQIKLPFSNPAEVVSYLPTIGYNPMSNMLRFAAAVLLPPLACLVYWWAVRRQKDWSKRLQRSARLRYSLAGIVVALGVLLSLGMAIVHGSTNPGNNPVDPYSASYRYAQVDTFHEGETLGPAISYADPSLKPYKDFVVIHGVLQDPLRTVWAFKLFGQSIGASRAMAVVLLMATFVLFYFLLVLLFKGDLVRSSLGVLVFAALTLPPATIPYWRDYIIGIQLPFRDIATILFIACAVAAFRLYLNKRRRWAAAMSAGVGFLAVAGFANSLDRALYVAILSVVWLVMMLAITGRKNYLKGVLSWFGLGAVAGFGVLYLALKGEFVDFIRYIADITKHKELLDGMPFARPGPEISLVLLVVAAFISLTLFWLVHNLSGPLSGRKSLGEKTRKVVAVLQKVIIEHHTLILLGITALIFMRSALGRAMIDHFFYAVQWTWLFLIYFVLAYVFPLRKKIGFAASFLAMAGLLLMTAVYAAQVKSIDIAADTFPVNVKDKDLVRPDYLETANFLKQNLRGEETFMTLTSEGIWYYLVGKPSPVQYPIIWYAFTKPERTQLARDLEQNENIKYLVTNHQWTTNFDYVPNEQRFPELYQVVYQLYEPHVGFGDQTIWIRK